MPAGGLYRPSTHYPPCTPYPLPPLLPHYPPTPTRSTAPTTTGCRHSVRYWRYHDQAHGCRLTGLARPVIKGPGLTLRNDHSGILKDSWLLGAVHLRPVGPCRPKEVSYSSQPLPRSGRARMPLEGSEGRPRRPREARNVSYSAQHFQRRFSGGGRVSMPLGGSLRPALPAIHQKGPENKVLFAASCGPSGPQGRECPWRDQVKEPGPLTGPAGL